MRELKEEFYKNSYKHNLVWRDEDYAITVLTDKDTNRIVCYEAFEIIKNLARKTDVMETEAFESTPSNEQWGYKGYTVTTKELAFNKITKLKSRKNEKTN
jgi:hypothetical protein